MGLGLKWWIFMLYWSFARHRSLCSVPKILASVMREFYYFIRKLIKPNFAMKFLISIITRGLFK